MVPSGKLGSDPHLDGLSHEDLRWALAGAGVGVWTWEIPSDSVRWSPELGAMHGLAPSQYPSTLAEFERLLHPEDRPLLRERLDKALSTRNADYAIEYRLLRPDGSVRWVRGVGRVELDAQGEPLRLGGTAIDVTEQVMAQAAVRAQEDQLRIFSELASDYVYVVNMRKPTLAPSIVAGSFSRVTGYTPEQVASKGGWLEIMHPEDRAKAAALVPELQKGKPLVNEYRIITRDGQTRWLRDRVRPVLEEGTLVRIVGGVQDITERKALEQQLQHAQRLEALARMAGGVAHDFNNIVFIVTGSLALMSPELEDRPEALACARDIKTACDRATELTQALLAFGRKNLAVDEVLSLPELVLGTRSILERSAGERVELVMNVDDDAGLVEVDRGLFQLALVNLAVNARLAMPDGGVLRIRVRRASTEESKLPELDTNETAIVEVGDNGQGIAPGVLPRVFEPFFTTRAPGQGTGLGLATVHGVIAQAGGAIRVRSKPGSGTVFTIHLPVVEAASKASQVSRRHATIGGTERVLLVEDDPAVRSLVTRMLESHGYDVISGSNLEEGQRLAEQQSFDLLLSDVRLPDGSGAMLASRLRGRRPGLPVLLISGYVDEESRQLVDATGFTLLPKPLTRDALARAVRRALDTQDANRAHPEAPRRRAHRKPSR